MSTDWKDKSCDIEKLKCVKSHSAYYRGCKKYQNDFERAINERSWKIESQKINKIEKKPKLSTYLLSNKV